MTVSGESPWRGRFALLTALATLSLIGLGGLVTSHGVGMAVPDWPNTYGYNLFFFPVSQWVGGIFYEHTHRLLASAVGLLTAVLALWLQGARARAFMRWGGLILAALGTGACLGMPHRQANGLILGITGFALAAAGFFWPRWKAGPRWLHGARARPFMQWAGLFLAALGTGVWLGMPHRPADGLVLGITGFVLAAASFFWPRCEAGPRWLRRLGLLAFFGVVVQGVLGGLRVVLFKDQLGIFHATLAQLFFALICAIALFTSNWWKDDSRTAERRAAAQDGASRAVHPALGRLFLGTTLLILLQLILGATMRHQHAGLAIPDFPLAYGRLWPAMDPAAVAEYNQKRLEVTSVNPITAFQIGLQMAHRAAAVLIVAAVAVSAVSARRRLGKTAAASKLSLAWLGLIGAQVALGAATIWSNKAADLATLHVLGGAVALALGVILCIIEFHEWVLAPGTVKAFPSASEAVRVTPLQNDARTDRAARIRPPGTQTA